ncbi:MAG TPA: hypothetical protein VLF41_00365 [Candidatus Nanoarchaeia archaeon]|nr:hypothetical protein [Candidatus Nanoarchaeia archaeon]
MDEQNRLKNFIFIGSAVVVVVFGTLLTISILSPKPVDAGTVGTIKLEDCLQINGEVADKGCRINKAVLRIVN